MENIIETIYLEALNNDLINPSEHFKTNDIEHQNSRKELCELENELYHSMNSDMKNLYNQIQHKISDITYIEYAGAFALGFKLGAEILKEVLEAK